jgi:CRISPR/Cas system-associated exonuclease Cas4 (RecB family)
MHSQIEFFLKKEWNWKTKKMQTIQLKLIKSSKATYIVRISNINYGHIKNIYTLEIIKNKGE